LNGAKVEGFLNLIDGNYLMLGDRDATWVDVGVVLNLV
jgi:hypothetical protein